jgi:hypothetical protein
MEPGGLLIVSLLTWYLAVMVIYWCSIGGQKTEAPVGMEVRVALREGQTILGVMDTTQSTCFCVGEIGEHVHDEEDTVQ